MRFRQTVTFQAPVKARTAAGQQVTARYDNVDSLVDLPATVIPSTIERRTDRLVLIEDAYQIVISGHLPQITTAMAVLDGEAVYDVLSVAAMAGQNTTIVTAQRVAI